MVTASFGVLTIPICRLQTLAPNMTAARAFEPCFSAEAGAGSRFHGQALNPLPGLTIELLFLPCRNSRNRSGRSVEKLGKDTNVQRDSHYYGSDNFSCSSSWFCSVEKRGM
jgi:hypothetical protein